MMLYYLFFSLVGFPGDLDVFVTCKLENAYSLSVTMEAKPLNKPTPVNLAQHSYWNLRGHNSGSTILSHTVQIFASSITTVDDPHIPTGEIAPVSNTPFDFLQPKPVGSRIANKTGGYDINYMLDSKTDAKGVRKVAVVEDGGPGRTLELWSDQPGVQFYTANFLKDVKGGAVYGEHAALCLETQGFPDSVNHPKFPSQIVSPGETYKHHMLYKFSMK